MQRRSGDVRLMPEMVGASAAVAIDRRPRAASNQNAPRQIAVAVPVAP